MRSFALAALALFAASTAHAEHGHHKGRQGRFRGECTPNPPQQTVTRSITIFPGREPVATGTSSIQASSIITSSKATSTQASSTIVTSSKAATTSEATTTSAKPVITTTSTRFTTISTTTTKPAVTTTEPAATSKPATTSTSSSTPPVATTTGGGTNGGLSAFAANILAAHNTARAPRNAKALTWSTEAEALAKAWGDKCIWQHGGNPGMGQNLAASAGYKQTGQNVVDAWMSEEKDYNPSSPSYSHFTQVVWKSTTAVGCFQSTCTKLFNPDGSETFPGFSPSYYTVCNYSPPGNFVGSAPQNVEKLS